MRGRRGQHEIQLHWVFALVGGFLFLLFFFILIRSVLSGHEDKTGRELQFAVETILTTAAANPESFTVAELPDENYRITCLDDRTAGIDSYVRIGDGNFNSHTLDYVPVFAPASIKGDQLFTLTRTWEAPFPVGTVVLASNNRTRYVLVGNTQKTKNFVEEENLAGFNFLVVGSSSISSVRDEGFNQYRFVFFTGPEMFTLPYNNLNDDFKKRGNTALVVHTNNDGESGTLDFYNDLYSQAKIQNDKNTGIPFYGRAMLDAAIFSQDYNTFSCNMKKGYSRLATTRKILTKRLEKLKDGVTNEQCKTIYQTSSSLNTYGSIDGATISPTGLIRTLEDKNDQLLSLDCPPIY